MNAITDNKPATVPTKGRRRLPTELSIFLVLIGIGLVFELFGWIVRDQSFLMNSQRLVLMILQVSIIGLLAIGVAQVIITTANSRHQAPIGGLRPRHCRCHGQKTGLPHGNG